MTKTYRKVSRLRKIFRCNPNTFLHYVKFTLYSFHKYFIPEVCYFHEITNSIDIHTKRQILWCTLEFGKPLSFGCIVQWKIIQILLVICLCCGIFCIIINIIHSQKIHTWENKCSCICFGFLLNNNWNHYITYEIHTFVIHCAHWQAHSLSSLFSQHLQVHKLSDACLHACCFFFNLLFLAGQALHLHKHWRDEVPPQHLGQVHLLVHEGILVVTHFVHVHLQELLCLPLQIQPEENIFIIVGQCGADTNSWRENHFITRWYSFVPFRIGPFCWNRFVAPVQMIRNGTSQCRVSKKT